MVNGVVNGVGVASVMGVIEVVSEVGGVMGAKTGSKVMGDLRVELVKTFCEYYKKS